MTTFPPGMPVPSPCISVCVMDAERGWCTGCQRTLDEIAVWSILDDQEKRAVWTALAGRRGVTARTVTDADR